MGWLLIWATTAQANMRFYSLVQQMCKNYNVTVSGEQMKLEGLEGDNPTFHLIIRSRPRNNYEQVLAIGYIAAGQANAQTNLGVKTVRVTVIIPNTDGRQISSEADIALVDQMRLGKIKPSEFIRELMFY
ncbi:hypothetical protein ACFL6E_04380 [Candidatus Neomarinimicrobiota bacterium]